MKISPIRENLYFKSNSWGNQLKEILDSTINNPLKQDQFEPCDPTNPTIIHHLEIEKVIMQKPDGTVVKASRAAIGGYAVNEAIDHLTPESSSTEQSKDSKITADKTSTNSNDSSRAIKQMYGQEEVKNDSKPYSSANDINNTDKIPDSTTFENTEETDGGGEEVGED